VFCKIQSILVAYFYARVYTENS